VPGVKLAFPKPYADTVARLRVPSGFLLVAAFVWLARPSLPSLLWGVPVSLAGLALRGWAAGHLAKNQSLAIGGPYAWLRNPLYAGTLLTAAGLVIAARRWELGLLFGAVFAFVYLPVIQLEEQHLRKLFPEYEDYASRVPLLLPHGKAASAAAEPFRWSLYRRNEEFQAALGYLAGLTVLIWKAL
jgi:protein-S-isoprenylcysteine O-methyltransferase Ste14